MEDKENAMGNSEDQTNYVTSTHLVELKGSDFQVEDKMSDIDDWEITDYTGLIIGKVRDLLFDTNAKKVRYIITILEGDDQKVLIPVGKVVLDEEANLVIVQGLTFRQLRGLPTYTKGTLTSEDEYAIQHLFQYYESKNSGVQSRNASYNSDTFYESEDFNQERIFKGLLGDDLDDVI